MKKTIMGALCAIVMTIAATSCTDNTAYVMFSDCTTIDLQKDDDGHIIGRTLYLADSSAYPIDEQSVHILTKRDLDPNTLLVITYTGAGEYHVATSHAKTEHINLH